jgi:hypothetical protein
MSKYLVAAALLVAFVTPALAETPMYYVGFDPVSKKCSMTQSKPGAGMKMMGSYKTEDEAKKAMAGMKECTAG